MNNSGSIGIFDSGIGGLSIASSIREHLPNEDIIYIADAQHTPYGEKSEAFIYDRCEQIVEYLIDRGVKVIVIACNTATVSAVEKLRINYSIPIIGVEPGVKPASLNSTTGVIGVLATSQTLKSDSFNKLSLKNSKNTTIELQACPGLVEQVESLNLTCIETVQLVEKYLQPLIKKGADNIVLGCTHYFYLATLIRKIAGPDIGVITTDVAVAKETKRRLTESGLLSQNGETGMSEFLSSGSTTQFNKQLELLWFEAVKCDSLVIE